MVTIKYHSAVIFTFNKKNTKIAVYQKHKKIELFIVLTMLQKYSAATKLYFAVTTEISQWWCRIHV